MKNAPRLRLILYLSWPLGLAGCDKPPNTKPPVVQPTPTPTVASASNDDNFSAKNIRHKADQAANSLEKFLQNQDPRMRQKVQRLADKVSAKLGTDKDHWREKLEEKRQELMPQIDQLKTQLEQGDDDKNKQKLRDALSKLEGKSADTDKKLAELEMAGADAWKQFKARLKDDEAHDNNTPPTDDTPVPTPSPTARLR